MPLAQVYDAKISFVLKKADKAALVSVCDKKFSSRNLSILLRDMVEREVRGGKK